MKEPDDYSQYVYVGGSSVAVRVCVRAYSRWEDQRGCPGSLKDPRRNQCFFVTSDGICERDKVVET